MNLEIESTGYYAFKAEKIPLVEYNFGLMLNNLSSSPISINNVSVLRTDGSFQRCVLTRRFLKEHYIPPGLNRPYQFFTADFPVNLAPHESKLIFVHFCVKGTSQIDVDANGKVLFRFTTNKKQIEKQLCVLPKTDFRDQ